MGGGDIDLKISKEMREYCLLIFLKGVSTDEFLQKTGYNITIADIVDDTETVKE